MAGVRINDIDLDVGLTLGQSGGSASESDTWVDVIAGLKGRTHLSDRIYVEGWGMIGGHLSSSAGAGSCKPGSCVQTCSNACGRKGSRFAGLAARTKSLIVG